MMGTTVRERCAVSSEGVRWRHWQARGGEEHAGTRRTTGSAVVWHVDQTVELEPT